MMRSLYRPGLRNAFHACNTSACSLRASLMQPPMLCAAGLPGPLWSQSGIACTGAGASATARASSGPMADLQGSGACLRFADSASSSHPSSERHSALQQRTLLHAANTFGRCSRPACLCDIAALDAAEMLHKPQAQLVPAGAKLWECRPAIISREQRSQCSVRCCAYTGNACHPPCAPWETAI